MFMMRVHTDHNATDLQYQILLINTISHVVTVVNHGVSPGSYVAPSSELVKQQQVHAVIINRCLTERLYSSKFYLSKSLTTPFITILHRQAFAPYGIC